MLAFCKDNSVPNELLVKVTKPVLCEHCKNILRENPRMEIDQIAEEKGVTILRLPPLSSGFKSDKDDMVVNQEQSQAKKHVISIERCS